jgi:putative DNA methylase
MVALVVGQCDGDRIFRMGVRLMALIAEGGRKRVYLPALKQQEVVALAAKPNWRPDLPFAHNSRHLTPWVYGLDNFGSLFTSRQLVALTTLSDLALEASERIRRDALVAGMVDDETSLDAGGTGALAYAEAVATFLGFLVDQVANHSSTLCGWNHPNTQMRSVFSRQALSMTWDFAEANVFSDSSGSFNNMFDRQIKGFEVLGEKFPGYAFQENASNQATGLHKVISTDPPYYDNVPYADLSDFFYVWLRRSLKPIFPLLFSTVAVPKREELVADPLRHQGKAVAEAFFLSGMTQAMHRLAAQAHPGFPITIYYAFKQSESEGAGTASTGWEIFLDAVMRSGLALTGTWPMRTEKQGRMRATESNALASSIVLVCRPRSVTAKAISRRAFLRELNQVLPEALDEMTLGAGEDRSPVAPVDLSQAIIGPGMAVFSKYAAVLEADGRPMTVQTALRLINRFLTEDDFDHDTQFCLHWFEQFGWKEAKFGDADVLARAKGTSVDGVKRSGVLYATGSIVRLLKWSEYPSGWNPAEDARLPVWEALHRLIWAFRTEGEGGAGKMLAAIATKAEPTRQLAYRLYTLCERAGWADDARAYNEIVTSWSAIESAAGAAPKAQQADLFG